MNHHLPSQWHFCCRGRKTQLSRPTGWIWHYRHPRPATNNTEKMTYVSRWEKIEVPFFTFCLHWFLFELKTEALLCQELYLIPHKKFGSAATVALLLTTETIGGHDRKVRKKWMSHFLLRFFNWILTHWPCMVYMSAPWLNRALSMLPCHWKSWKGGMSTRWEKIYLQFLLEIIF